MTPALLTPEEPDLAALLKRLQLALAQDDAAGLTSTLTAIGPQCAAEPTTLLGALCIGGARLATRLAGEAFPELDEDGRTAVVLHALMEAIEPPAAGDPDHERQVAQALIDRFHLTANAETLLDGVRAEFLVRCGPLSELPEAVLGAMRLQQWNLALDGLQRVRTQLKAATPRNVHGLRSMCLHRLGRYADAEQALRDGMGNEHLLLAVPEVRTEAELMRRWGKGRRPVVSILCTTFNHERYIETAIRGFLCQDCEHPFEILIHDDASTDDTQRVIRAWQQRYPRIIKPLLQTENQLSRGVRPLELLLARAQGDYVATCEGDDYWIAPDKLQRQVSFLMRHPDVSCSAHNYYHFIETSLSVRPWSRIGKDFFVSPRQMMAAQFLLWFPTLVFRKTFSALPPERALAAFGDQFLSSYLGTMGRCAYFETLIGAVRRENEFSSWTPLPAEEKERRRVRTWTAMLRLHQRLGNQQAVLDLQAKIAASPLDAQTKAAIDSAAHLAPEPQTEKV